MRALIIEDELRLAQNIAQALKETSSFAVDISADGRDGQHMALSNPYDVIILDLMLPHIDGWTLLGNLRQQGNRTPVLILTARDSQSDIIRGLDMGSDDYLTKPFDMGELIARCKALARRAFDHAHPVITVDDLSVDTTRRMVSLRGRPISLSAMEYRLLEYLALRRGQIVSKTEIAEHLYDFNAENFSNTIEVYISTLRRKLDPGPEHHLLHTVRGQGYLLGGTRP